MPKLRGRFSIKGFLRDFFLETLGVGLAAGLSRETTGVFCPFWGVCKDLPLVGVSVVLVLTGLSLVLVVVGASVFFTVLGVVVFPLGAYA
jgi:hypothetical protein